MKGLWVPLDIEFCDDPGFIELECGDPRALSRLARLLQLTRRYGEDGRICRRDGRLATPHDLALIAERRPDTAPDWERFLLEAARVGLLEQVDGGFRFADWADRWSVGETAAAAERKRLQRDREALARERAELEVLRSAVAVTPPDDDDAAGLAPVTPPSQPVTPGHAASQDVTPHEHEHEQIHEQRHEHAPPTPPPGGTAGAPSEVDLVTAECLELVQRFHGSALPQKLERGLAAAVRDLLLAGAAGPRVLEACRRAIAELTADDGGMGQPAYGVASRLKRYAGDAPPANDGTSGRGTAIHQTTCKCQACQLAREVERWGDDLPLPPRGAPGGSLADQQLLEDFCRRNHPFLANLPEPTLGACIAEALDQVRDVRPHVRDTVRHLAQHLRARAAPRATPGPRLSPTHRHAPEPAAAG